MLSLPPTDLGTRSLPVETFAPGEVIYRIHRTALGAKFFGRTGQWRFDSPDLAFGTLYAATSAEIAFAETLLRGQPSARVGEDELALRSLLQVYVGLIPLAAREAARTIHGELSALPSAVTSGSYGLFAERGRRPCTITADLPDGILYRSTTDNDRVAVAVFERAGDALGYGALTPLLDDLGPSGGDARSLWRVLEVTNPAKIVLRGHPPFSERASLADVRLLEMRLGTGSFEAEKVPILPLEPVPQHLLL